MVEHINRMAHEFGLKTIAEFVEDEETAQILAEIGVDSAQGYHFGRPAAPD
jgi:EAL domain-containing protein (putative c-di-GMP-specific phosphodiesterase class I)